MGPISDYNGLLQVVKYNQDESEQWYIILLFNPLNRTPATKSFLNNYNYLNDRTGHVRYFIPGLQNDAQLKGEIYGKGYTRIQLSEDTCSYMLFNQDGFLSTVNWLEDNCPRYEYREGIDLILLKSYGYHSDAKLDVRNLICIPLDDVYRHGGNVIDTIASVRKVVNQNLQFREAQEYIRQHLILEMRPSRISRVKVFIAGSKKLFHERNVVRSQLQQISNRTNITFSSYTYEDFSRSFAEEGQQTEYNEFIANQADCAIFIIDGLVGGITFEEFNIAMSSFINNGKPSIYVYCKDITSKNRDIRHIIREINYNHQYYCEYDNIDQLELSIRRDFMDLAWKLAHKG